MPTFTQRKRAFIALPIDKRTRTKIQGELEQYSATLPEEVVHAARFVSPEMWHITLSFLGDLGDDEIARTAKALQVIRTIKETPQVHFEKMCLGPLERTPRMIWLLADKRTSEELGKVKTLIEEHIQDEGVHFRMESRRFVGHITLARLDSVTEKRSEERTLDIRYEPNTISLMESHLMKGGAEYIPLQNIQFEGATLR